MPTDFETWAMRGLVASLGLTLAWFIRRDDCTKTKAIETLREDYTSSLEAFSERFGSSLDRINGTMSGLAGAISDLRLMVGREYATREEMQGLEERCERRLAQCANACRERERAGL